MIQYGQSGLHLDGHSCGSMTIGNAMESLTNRTDAQGSLSGTTVNFFGPAYNVQQADGLLSNLQKRSAMPENRKADSALLYMNHVANPVGSFLGRNEPTGGSIPVGSNKFTEQIRAATGQENTSHNCYGFIGANRNCGKLWEDEPSRLAPVPPIVPLHQLGGKQ